MLLIAIGPATGEEQQEAVDREALLALAEENIVQLIEAVLPAYEAIKARMMIANLQRYGKGKKVPSTRVPGEGRGERRARSLLL